MKFLVDAQLPRRLVLRLREAGHDAVHTLDLPNGNRTSDAQVNAISIAEQRVVITKDADFVDSFLLQKLPWKLLLVSTGNISNRDLERLFAANLSSIVNGFLTHDYIEITRANVIFHC
jgi:predicted nuclease of predicted toxin-antitoxin system